MPRIRESVGEKEKLQWVKPRLERLGDFRMLTKMPAKAGGAGDGTGVPKTKATGSA